MEKLIQRLRCVQCVFLAGCRQGVEMAQARQLFAEDSADIPMLQ